MAELTTADLSLWLVGVIQHRLKGVSIRDEGGVYFVPKEAMSTWDKVRAAIEAATCRRPYLIPAMSSADTLRAVLDAMISEITKELKAFNVQIGSDTVGPKAARTAGDTCDALIAKVEGYEKLVGKPIGTLRSQLGEARRQLAAKATRFSLLETY